MAARRVLRVLAAMSLMTTGFAATTARAADSRPDKMECIAADTEGQKLRLISSLIQARKRFAVCAAASCPGIVREDCQQRIAEVDVAQPTVVFAATNGYGRSLVAVRVSVDGTRIADRLDGRPLPVDPGDHLFAFEALGRIRATMRLSLSEGDRVRHAVVLATESGDPVDEVPAPPPMTTGVDGSGDQSVPLVGSSYGSVASPAGSPETPTSRQALSGSRIAAILAGGVGILGLTVGGVFGVLTITTWDAAKNDGREFEAKQASKDGDISTVAFAVGGVGLAAAAWLWFSAPEASARGVSVAPAPGPSGCELTVRGKF